jgi:hypothetical protein
MDAEDNFGLRNFIDCLKTHPALGDQVDAPLQLLLVQLGAELPELLAHLASQGQQLPVVEQFSQLGTSWRGGSEH